MNLKNLFLCALAVFIFTTPQPLYCPSAQDYLQQAFDDYSDMTGEPFEGSPFAMGFTFAILKEDTENPFPEISDVEKLHETLITSGEKPDLFEFIDGFLHGHSMLFKNIGGTLERHGLNVKTDDALADSSTSYALGQEAYKGDATDMDFIKTQITPLVDPTASSPRTLVIKMKCISFLAGARTSRLREKATDPSLLPKAIVPFMTEGHHIRKNSSADEITKFLSALTLPFEADPAAEEDIIRLQVKAAHYQAEIARYQAETARHQATLAELQAQITELHEKEIRLWQKTQKGSKTKRSAALRKYQLAQQQRERAQQERERLHKLLADTARPKPVPVAPRSAAVQAEVEAGIDAARARFLADEALEAEKAREANELQLMDREEKQQREHTRNKKLKAAAEQERLHRASLELEKKREARELRRMRHEEHGQLAYAKQQRRHAHAQRIYQAAMSKAGQEPAYSTTQPSFAPLPQPADLVHAESEVTETLTDATIAILAQEPDDADVSSSPPLLSANGTSDDEDGDAESVVDSTTLSDGSAASAERHDTALSIEVLPPAPRLAPPLPPLPPPGPYLDGFLHGRNTILYSPAGTRDHFIDNMLCHAHGMIQRIQAHIATEHSTTGWCAPVHYANLHHWIGIYNGVCSARHLLVTYYHKGLHAGRHNDEYRKMNITTEFARIAPMLKFDHLLARLNLKKQFDLGFEHGQESPFTA